MPIVSRTLTKLANREDIGPGVKRWRVDGVDSRGATWTHGPFFGTQAEAEAVRDKPDLWTTDQLAEQDERVGFDALDRTGDPDAFTPADLTRDEWNARVLNRFFGASIETDRRLLCRTAAWVAGFTARDIAGLLGVTQPEAQAQIDRAIDLRDSVCPAMDANDGERDPTRESVRSR